MKGQQKAAETEEGTVQIQEGAVATGEDPTSVAIASIQSAATFPDPNIKYVFRTENGGTQVMYRVIQVADGQLDGQTEGTSAISGYPAAQSMTQATEGWAGRREARGGLQLVAELCLGTVACGPARLDVPACPTRPS
nr:PREDICTED: upstream stimulatory factor 1-like [Apteryx mantelli mantelli]